MKNEKWHIIGTEIINQNGYIIAECDLSEKVTIGNKKANAKLIAAAPELLEACIEVMKGGYGCAPSVEFMDSLKKKCENAINKAIGL